MPASKQIIGIDASRSVGRIRTGTENYSAQLISGLTQQETEFAWRLYFNSGSDELGIVPAANVEIRDIPAPRLWTHLRLSRELLQHRVDGLFVPAHVVPLYHPPTVVTIHDLGYLHWPEAHPKNQRRMLDLTTRWSAKVARHIIVPSQQTADDLERFYHVNPEKMTVIHHGIDPSMGPKPIYVDATLRDRLGLHRPFVLAVGTIQPRKNLPVLARSMKRIIQNHDIDLVIAGRKGWMADDVLSEVDAAGLGDHLRVIDYVPAEDLPALYRAAKVFVQPSRFEGFGMPVLEAMASGTPVISAEGSSLDEIGGDAALRFRHDSDEQLAHHLETLLSNSNEAARLVQAGLVHSSGFTWEQTATKTRIVLEENLLK